MAGGRQLQKCFEMNQAKLLTRELCKLRGTLLTKGPSETTGQQTSWRNKGLCNSAFVGRGSEEVAEVAYRVSGSFKLSRTDYVRPNDGEIGNYWDLQ